MTTPTRTHFLYLGISITLVGIVWLIYQPGLSGPFVFDDFTNILVNPALHNIEFSLDAFKEAMFSNDSGLLGRPLSMLSFAINAALTRFDVYYFKLTNLVIHIINGLLLGVFTYKVLQSYNQTQSSSLTANHLKLVSLLVTSLWLFHPLNLTSVLYVVQRMNSLSTLFMLAGIVTYVIAREKLIAGNRSGLWLLLSLPLWTAMAVFSKENGVLLPVYVLLIELLFYRFKSEASLNTHFRWLFVAIVVLPITLGLGLFFAKTDIFLNYQLSSFTLEQRVLTETRVLWFYLSLILIPDISRMGLFHDDFVISDGLLEPATTLLAASGILALIVLSIALVRRLPLVSFSILWFLIGHSLESSVFPLELVHEHRNYLPQFGPVLGLVFYVLYPYKRKTGANSSDAYAQFAFIFIYIVLAAYNTYARSEYWRSSWTLAAQEVKTHPGSVRANTYAAVLLHKKKQYDLALDFFVKAINLDPADPQTRIRLIQHLYQSKKPIPEELIQETRDLLPQGIAVDPEVLHTLDPLLIVTADSPELSNKIIAMYEQYISDNGADRGWRLFAYNRLMNVYRMRNNPGKVLYYLQKTIELDKATPGYYLEAAEILTDLGKPKTARELLDTLQSSNILLGKEDADRLSNILRKLK
jgi:protein O-mannosyl-transferase